MNSHSSPPKRSLGLSYLRSLGCPGHLTFYIQLSQNPNDLTLWNFLPSTYSSHFQCHHPHPEYRHLMAGKPQQPPNWSSHIHSSLPQASVNCTITWQV